MGFLDLFRRRTETPAPAPAPAPVVASSGNLDELDEAARKAVLPGFLSRTEAIERVREELELSDDATAVEDAVDRVWQARLAEEATWSDGSSDYERVARAFAALNDAGMVARMDFTCCNNCGNSEIGGERTALSNPGDGYRYREEQFVFFHQQDSDRLVDEPAQLFLTFGAWRAARDTDPELLAAARKGDKDAEKRIHGESDRKVGEQVRDALAAEGLVVTWSGNPAERLAVEIAHWRKPLPR